MAPNHSTSVMAFGVKWNETEESGSQSAELRASEPGVSLQSPAPTRPPVRMRGLPAAPGDSILPLGPR